MRVQTLRPLRLGEILDRAVTLTVRSFIPLALIWMVFEIPYAVVQYFASRDFARFIAEVTKAVEVQAAGGKTADPNVLLRYLAQSSAFNEWTAALLAFVFVVGPLPAGALIDAIAAYYEGRPVTFGSAYRVALRRWLPLIGIDLLYLAAGIALYVAAVIVGVILALGLVFITQLAHTIGIAIAVIAALVAALALMIAGALALVALQTSFFACVVEGTGVVRSFALGVTRVFGRLGFRRAVLVGSAFLAVEIGIVVLKFAVDAVFVGLLHSTIAAEAGTAVLNVAAAVFVTSFLGVFYFDLRVRAEGYDLQLAAQDVRSQTLPV